VIKTVALGVGAITTAKKSPPPPQSQEVVMPVVAGNKADRLLIINQDPLTSPEKVDVVHVPPSEQSQADLPPPTSQEPATPAHHDFARRHRHDPHHLKTHAAKRRAHSAKDAKKLSADRPPKTG
jgi:hypothetical protein